MRLRGGTARGAAANPSNSESTSDGELLELEASRSDKWIAGFIRRIVRLI
jgi:hypothetical protein